MEFFQGWEPFEELLTGSKILAVNQDSKNIALEDGTVVDLGFKGLKADWLTSEITIDNHSIILGRRISRVQAYCYPSAGKDRRHYRCTAYISILLGQGAWYDLLCLTVTNTRQILTPHVLATFIPFTTGEEILKDAELILKLEGQQWTLEE